MKLREIIPSLEYDKQMKRARKGSWLSNSKYRSQNSKNGGVTRWSYSSGKQARNTY